MRGLCCLQSIQDGLKDAVGIVQYIVVPESQNLIAVLCKPFVPGHVAGIGCVLTAVEFNNDFLLAADEVDNVGANGFLADEFETAQRA